MGKIKDYFVAKSDKDVFVDKSPKKWSIILLALSAIYIIVLFATRFNFLAPISVALALVSAIAIFSWIFFKGKVNLYLLLCYPVLFGGTLLFFIFFGAEGFGKSLGYNLLMALIVILSSIAIIILLVLKSPKMLRYILTSVFSFVLICGTVFYFLTMSMRVKPTVERMYEGEQDYLDQVSRLSTDENSPNVLFILMDDLGYSDLSSYSYLSQANATIQTPNIDSIGDAGVIMENFYTTSPVCSPSRFSILTGRYQSRGYLDNVVFPTCVSLNPFGATRYYNPYQFANNVDGILGDEVTFAEALQAHGYNTACVGKWNLGDYGEYLPTNQGFDYFFGSYYVNDMTPYNIVRETNGEVGEEIYSHNDLLDQSGSTRLFTDEVKSFITESVDNNEKFLAYYTTPWPHYPIFSGTVGDKTDDNYIDCVEEFDSAVGELIALLQEKGVYDDTIIVFTSDNGPGREGAVGALRGRKNTTFEGGHKVPMLVSYPNGGIGQGSYLNTSNVITAAGSEMDFFPTLLDYCGISTLPQDRIIDGKNIRTLWEGTVAPTTVVHDKLFYIKKGSVQAIQMTYTAEDGTAQTYKYYESVRSENSAFIDQVYKNYLFDLDADPAEAYNVSMVHPEIASNMLSELKEFRASLKNNPRGIR